MLAAVVTLAGCTGGPGMKDKGIAVLQDDKLV